MSNSPHRSFARITPDDLARLAKIALDDFADLCQRKEYCRRYADRLRLICLCQGAARHYVHHDRGVWDFDLWGFFEEVRGHPFPYRRRGEHDFGPSKFGRDPEDDFEGRKVDVIGRSIRMPSNETPIEAVQRYLREGRTESAIRLAERPVVVVWPGKISIGSFGMRNDAGTALAAAGGTASQCPRYRHWATSAPAGPWPGTVLPYTLASSPKAGPCL